MPSSVLTPRRASARSGVVVMVRIVNAFLCPDPSQGLIKVWCSSDDKDSECIPLS